MKKLYWAIALAVITFISTSMAFDLMDLTGTSGNTTYSASDVFGDIVGTIPSSAPGTNNAWTGMVWANGYLYAFKNISPSTVPSQFLKINPTTGAVMNTYNFPFNGYVMGGAYDGSGLWVAQYSPFNVIWKISLTGTIISSFTPPSMGVNYSARCPNWDGTYLWVGYDSSATYPNLPQTKMAKLTTAGALIQQWNTTAAVGWYMGGVFCSDAPAGANLFVVDNVGNTIKRLNLGATITTAQQVNSPAVSPDIAEGLAFDGDNLWHNGVYANLGVIWKIDDGYPGIAPALNVTVTPIGSTVIPSTGGQLNFNAAVTSTGPQTPFMVWGRVKNPDGSYNLPSLGPISINPPINVNVNRNKVQNVPGSWNPGTYYFLVYGGLSISYPAIDADSFMFTKSADFSNGPMVWDASCTGEPFPGEVAVSALTTFSMAGATPNPFNPTTVIRYQMQDASHVNLKIYDTMGRLVTTLVNGWREAGRHEVTFDGSNLTSGLYLYTLTAGNQTASGKMMLIK